MRLRAFAALLAAGALGASQSAQAATVTCRSNGGYERCNANTSEGVTLQRELAGSCAENRTWGYDPGGIWVDRGCEASFETGSKDGEGAGVGTALAVIGALAAATGVAVALTRDDDNDSSRDDSRRYANYDRYDSEAQQRRPTAISMCTDYASRIVKDAGGNGARLDRIKHASYDDDKWRIEAYMEARWQGDNPRRFVECTVSFEGKNRVTDFRHDGLESGPRGAGNRHYSRDDRRDDRELAVIACQNEARRQNYRVRDVDNLDRHSGRYDMSLELEMRHDRYVAECRYDVADRDARLHDIERRR